MAVTNKNKLLFFNKEGYPYNFELLNGIYSGKLLFDENSSDLFKTIGIYMFEEVPAFSITEPFLLNKYEIYNNSGLSFHAETEIGLTIDNIKSVNSAPTFYSKWIYGNNFDQYFPKGTLVSFSGLEFMEPITFVPVLITDFDNEYYTILDNKPGAILINTETENSVWNYIFTGNTALINSHNIISYNDNDSIIYPIVDSWSLHTDKKFSIVGTEYNDNVIIYDKYEKMRTIYQNYDIVSLSASTSQSLRFDFELKTERPKLYQGLVNFNLDGSQAILTFNRKLNSLINLEEGEQMIFEDYDDESILPGNPIFTIISDTEDIDLYTGDVDFVKELNVNKTFMKHFNSKELSSINFIKNTTLKFFKENIDDFLNTYPSSFFIFDNYIQITGSTTIFDSELLENNTIFLKGTTSTSGSTRHKNSGSYFNIKKIKTFEDIRISFWSNEMKNNDSWFNSIKKKAIVNENELYDQIYFDAKWMYDTRDNKVGDINYIPLTERYEQLILTETVILEEITNEYNIQKILKATDIKSIVCSMSIPVPYQQTFDMNVIAYDTSNILSFEQKLLPYSDTVFKNEKIEEYKQNIRDNNAWYLTIVDTSSGTTSDENLYFFNNTSDAIEKQINEDALQLYNQNYHNPGYIVSWENTLNAFNQKYGSYLKDRYGILVYLDDDKINLYSIYDLNFGVYDSYFEPSIYLDNVNILSTGATTGITNYEINKVLIETKTSLINENFYPNEPEKFDTSFDYEIYFDLMDNETHYGFMLDFNDVEYYIDYDNNNDSTISTIQNFINKYSTTFIKNGFILSTGTTILVDVPDEYIYTTATTITIPGEDISGYTLKINGLYPNVDVTTINTTVNLYSKYEIVVDNDNDFTIMSGNELELQIGSLFDYGFATGTIVNLTDSYYTQNNTHYNIIGLTDNVIDLSYQGLFFNEEKIITLDVDTFLRKPRESANKNIYYNWRFLENDNRYNYKDIFFYDVSGEHLKPYKNIKELEYTGIKPLWNIKDDCDGIHTQLIDKPNNKLDFVSDPQKQQTVFRGEDGGYCLEFLLDQYDSVSEFNYVPEPLQCFLGYNSKDEGVTNVSAVLEKVEYITFSGYTNSDKNENGINFNFTEYGELEIITNDFNFNFRNVGFETKQPITIDFIDQQKNSKITFKNYGTFIIETVHSRRMVVVSNLNIQFTSFTTNGNKDGFYYEIKVQPNPILKLNLFGETEIEDERFKIVLNNLGIQIDEDVEQIFKETDIKEHGIDYTLLNQKRKEMLVMYPEIYNYIGSYKSLINSINFFGWNDLQLNEYYKNIDTTSPLYKKLMKVEIQDIFDNTVEGYKENDFIKGKYKTGNYVKTNLFNLTYKITDEDGNNVLMYSLDEVQIKLNKLKRWLRRNTLPLSTNLVDITGVANTIVMNYQNYDVSNVLINKECYEETTVVNFNLQKTLNFNTEYLIELDFYTRNGVIPSGWTCKIQTFSKDETTNKLIPQKYLKLMKNDLDTYSFHIDEFVDDYIYVETIAYNDRGVAEKYNKLINTSTSKNYILVNNRFHMIDYNYLNIGESYYFFDDDGFIYLED